MSYKIEKGIQKLREPKRPVTDYLFPFTKMKVGDSFVIMEEFNNNNRTKWSSRVKTNHKKLLRENSDPEFEKMQFSLGKDPKSSKWIRVWRIK